MTTGRTLKEIYSKYILKMERKKCCSKTPVGFLEFYLGTICVKSMLKIQKQENNILILSTVPFLVQFF